MQIKIYPFSPGYKDKDTSKKAAEKYESKSEKLCKEILLVLARGSMSAFELADHFNEPITSIRPRVTQLKNRNLIEDSGERHLTEGGCYEKVWRLKIVPLVQPIYDDMGQGILLA